MFSATLIEDQVVLESKYARATILPNCGAILNSWIVQINDKNIEIIEGYPSPQDFGTQCEALGFRSCKLSPFVCRLNNSTYQFDNQSFTTNKFALNGSAIHGLLYNESFKVLEVKNSEDEASVTLGFDYCASDAGYPYPYGIEVTYMLSGAATLTLYTRCTNKHTTSIPLSDGWHPYFSLGRPVDELHLQMASQQIVAFDEALIPTGEILEDSRFYELQSLQGVNLDNCFPLQNSPQEKACLLVNKADNIALQINALQGYPYLQIYTPPHRKSIAIENLSSVPDAFNNHIGLQLVAPNETISFCTQYQITQWQ